MNRIYHVSKDGNDNNIGNEKQPFLTINQAAQVATLGDTVIVHQGTYREWVNPLYGGTSEATRITYKVAPNEHVVIKGSEKLTEWTLHQGTVWKTIVNNTIFGDYNPYTEVLYGDWFLMPMPEQGKVHTGEVYLNGQSFYEAQSIEEVLKAEITAEVNLDGREYIETRLYPEHTKYQWYAVVEEQTTTIFANFHQYNPNKELVEFNVRQSCFYPKHTGINYITVQGFELAHAATPFTPPTADQPGLIGPHWSYGWIIENNCIHDAKCSAISLGKERSTGHNEHALYHLKPGFQGQIESVFQALQKDWKKEVVGSHIVRNNTIYNCGQNGIVGHMGCVFSKITGNHIYNIGIKYEFFGWEIAGIKLHAPIDVVIENNYVHHCYLGLWLDWQTQGTRISRNIFRENPRDCVIEVSHGPYIFDHNIFGSKTNVSMLAQGGAFVHNLFCGELNIGKVLDRSTPYHFPHSTAVKGCSLVYGKDDRFYNNVFAHTDKLRKATNIYNGATTSLEEYRQTVLKLGNEDIEKYVRVEQPVYIDGNVYAKKEEGFKQEQHAYDTEIQVEFVEKQDRLEIQLKVPTDTAQILEETKPYLHNTCTLGTVRIVDAAFEDHFGNSIEFNKDFNGIQKAKAPMPGPFEDLVKGESIRTIWETMSTYNNRKNLV